MENPDQVEDFTFLPIVQREHLVEVIETVFKEIDQWETAHPDRETVNININLVQPRANITAMYVAGVVIHSRLKK